jgi:hypothetical protein
VAGSDAAGHGTRKISEGRVLIDEDNGGSGSLGTFANDPSPNTVMATTAGVFSIMNVLSGFTTGFSFFYSSSAAVPVNVYDGLNASRNILATSNLVAQHDGNNCTGDPTGSFCNWTAVNVLFSGTAMSVLFTGSTGFFLLDDITLTPESGSASVPEPASLLLVGSGLAGLGAFTWRRDRRK